MNKQVPYGEPWINTIASLVNESLELHESRKDNLTYTEKKVKGEIDRVTVTLEGRDSEKYTKMAKNYKRIKTQIERLQKLQENLNAEAKQNVEELFDATDEVYTRVVDTVSLSLTLSKKPVMKDTSKTDYESVVGELLKLQPELGAQLEKLITQYTKVTTGAPKPAALRVDIKEGVVKDASKAVWNKIKSMLSTFLDSIKKWGKSYDDKLTILKDKMNGLNESYEDNEEKRLKILGNAIHNTRTLPTFNFDEETKMFIWRGRLNLYKHELIFDRLKSVSAIEWKEELGLDFDVIVDYDETEEGYWFGIGIN